MAVEMASTFLKNIFCLVTLPMWMFVPYNPQSQLRCCKWIWRIQL